MGFTEQSPMMPPERICSIAYVLPRMSVTLEADMIGKATSNAGAQYPAAPGRRKVALALQGGGSHGAFTWGAHQAVDQDGAIHGACASSGHADDFDCFVV
jgi:predicted acylesterase/phospholipase RssA